MFLRIGAMNVGQGGGAYCAPIMGLLKSEQIDICALQEVDLRPDNAISFERYWRSQGWFAAVALKEISRQSGVQNELVLQLLLA